MTKVVQVSNPPKTIFAGLIITDGVVTKVAPVIKYVKGWQAWKAEAHFKSKGWTWNVVTQICILIAQCTL